MRQRLAIVLCVSVLGVACGSGRPAPEPSLSAPEADARPVGTTGFVTVTAADAADARITAAVESRLQADPRASLLDIQVSTANAIVMLNGDVASRRDAIRAAALVRTIGGVRKVVDNLQTHEQ